mmetsp:Transcript_83072/g.164784  ORF Transcript_83072/g.164784 Transcript_83072/m.164784 type:complete len:226 (+) Transcript_83072:180-857(+)
MLAASSKPLPVVVDCSQLNIILFCHAEKKMKSVLAASVTEMVWSYKLNVSIATGYAGAGMIPMRALTMSAAVHLLRRCPTLPMQHGMLHAQAYELHVVLRAFAVVQTQPVHAAANSLNQQTGVVQLLWAAVASVVAVRPAVTLRTLPALCSLLFPPFPTPSPLLSSAPSPSPSHQRADLHPPAPPPSYHPTPVLVSHPPNHRRSKPWTLTWCGNGLGYHCTASFP